MVVVLECRGMRCPRPIVEMAKAMRNMDSGDMIELLADDPVAKKDVPSWCEKTGHKYEGMEDLGSYLKFHVKKA